MKVFKKLFLPLVLAISFSISSTNAQTLKTPAPSPLQTIKQNFGIGELSLEYSRPSVKNRVIFGDVVPYGKMWRTGANASTKITIGEDTKIEGNAIPAGTYAIYTIPGAETWEIMFYKDLTLGGDVASYKKENEVLRITEKVTQLPNKVETFTINFADITYSVCNVEMQWEKTRVAFTISTEVDAKIMKNIETVMAPNDRRPYYNAASYYYDNNKDIKQALEWVNKATELTPDAYWVWHLKAKIQLKLKDAKGAIETAEKSKALALKDKDDAYVKNNDKLIAEAKAMK
jgi:tetratricopeptide (TPR) repeat protein